MLTELTDRFGDPPSATLNLMRIARLRLAARRLGVRRLDFGLQGGYLLFEKDNHIDPKAVIGLLQRSPREHRLEGPLKLRVTHEFEDPAERFDFVAALLQRLGGAQAAV